MGGGILHELTRMKSCPFQKLPASQSDHSAMWEIVTQHLPAASASCGCCDESPQGCWLKTIHIYCLQSWRSEVQKGLTGLKSRSHWVVFLPDAPGEELFPGLCVSRGSCIPWLAAPSSIFRASRGTTAELSLLYLCGHSSFSAPLRTLGDYIGSAG